MTRCFKLENIYFEFYWSNFDRQILFIQLANSDKLESSQTTHSLYIHNPLLFFQTFQELATSTDSAWSLSKLCRKSLKRDWEQTVNPFCKLQTSTYRLDFTYQSRSELPVEHMLSLTFCQSSVKNERQITDQIGGNNSTSKVQLLCIKTHS